MTGVLLQWRFHIDTKIIWVTIVISGIITVSFFILPFFRRYKLATINGTAISILFISFGCLIAWQKDIRNDKNWFGNDYNNKASVVVTLLEKPVEKTNSLKANASVDHLLKNDSVFNTNGSIKIGRAHV